MTTIENMPSGNYLCRCQECGETFELNESNCLGKPMWVMLSLMDGFNKEHKNCE